jgi:hypothetical protein
VSCLRAGWFVAAVDCGREQPHSRTRTANLLQHQCFFQSTAPTQNGVHGGCRGLRRITACVCCGWRGVSQAGSVHVDRDEPQADSGGLPNKAMLAHAGLSQTCGGMEWMAQAHDCNEPLFLGQPWPTFCQPWPTFCKPWPTFCKPWPTFCQPWPTFCKPWPTFCQPWPTFCQPWPTFCQPWPTFCKPWPTFCQPWPTFCKPWPTFCQPWPAFSSIFPVFCLTFAGRLPASANLGRPFACLWQGGGASQLCVFESRAQSANTEPSAFEQWCSSSTSPPTHPPTRDIALRRACSQ